MRNKIKDNNFFNPKYFRKSLPFYLPIFFGVLYKLNTIGLFILPLQGVYSISRGSLSPRLKEILESLNLIIPEEVNLFGYFFLLISLSIASLVIIKNVKDVLVLKLKNRMISKYIKSNKPIKGKKLKIQKTLSKIEQYISNSENFANCMLLLFFLFFFDLEIALITIFSGIIYYLLLKKKFNKRNLDDEDLDQIVNVDKSKTKLFLKKLIRFNSNDKDLIKSIMSGTIMLIILIAVYKREDPSISIIFIFLTRILQNQMFTGINALIKEKENLL